MVGITFIFRIVQFLVYFSILLFLLWAIVFVLSRATRFFLERLGVELEETRQWLWIRLPKPKKRRKRVRK